jgi:hypothetical protein
MKSLESIREAIDGATEALVKFRAAALPKTEKEYWAWLRYNDPLRFIVEKRAAEGKRSPVQRIM